MDEDDYKKIFKKSYSKTFKTAIQTDTQGEG